MTTIPNYDAWRLAAPDDDRPDPPCETCGGSGYLADDGACPDCDGPMDEPDDDYLFERARDARGERE